MPSIQRPGSYVRCSEAEGRRRGLLVADRREERERRRRREEEEEGKRKYISHHHRPLHVNPFARLLLGVDIDTGVESRSLLASSVSV